MDRWFNYKRNFWHICVNATGRRDADEHIKRSAPGAKYIGDGLPANPEYVTGMVTEKRHIEIHNSMAGDQ